MPTHLVDVARDDGRFADVLDRHADVPSWPNGVARMPMTPADATARPHFENFDRAFVRVKIVRDTLKQIAVDGIGLRIGFPDSQENELSRERSGRLSKFSRKFFYC
jgi:hypothetical protein